MSGSGSRSKIPLKIPIHSYSEKFFHFDFFCFVVHQVTVKWDDPDDPKPKTWLWWELQIWWFRIPPGKQNDRLPGDCQEMYSQAGFEPNNKIDFAPPGADVWIKDTPATFKVLNSDGSDFEGAKGFKLSLKDLSSSPPPEGDGKTVAFGEPFTLEQVKSSQKVLDVLSETILGLLKTAEGPIPGALETTMTPDRFYLLPKTNVKKITELGSRLSTAIKPGQEAEAEAQTVLGEFKKLESGFLEQQVNCEEYVVVLKPVFSKTTKLVASS